MANPEQTGLSTNPANINQYGANPADLQEYQDSLAAQIKSLEDRYSNPNWFKVAAGFLKPQLGGFAASLGSASEALGENVEAGRQAALPIAQMRSQLAQSKIAMGQNQKAAQMLSEHTGPVTADFVQQLEALGDTPSARAARKTYESANAERGLASSELANAIQRVQYADLHHQPHNPADDKLIGAGSGTQPPAAGSPAPKITSQPVGQALTPEGQPASYTGTPMSDAMLQKLKVQAYDGDAEAAAALNAYKQSPASMGAAPTNPAAQNASPTTPKPVVEKFSPSVRMPDLAGQNPQDAEYLRKTADTQAATLEKPYQDEISALSYLTRPGQFNQAKGDTEAALTLMRQYPDVAKKVFDVVRQAGPVAAAGEAGFGVHVGPYGASINLPTKAWLDAGISDKPVAPGQPSPRSIADKLSQYLASSAFYGMVSRGIDPSTAGSEKMSLAMSQEPLMKNTAASAYSSLQSNLNSFNMAKELRDAYASERDKLDKNTLTPYHDIATQSSVMKKIRAKYDLINKATLSNFTGQQPAQ